MQVETKFLRLFREVAIGDRIDGASAGLADGDKCRSQFGRFRSPDVINLTSDRLMSPSTTLNKYVYAADNPLRYVDPDGKDITIFYRPPSW